MHLPETTLPAKPPPATAQSATTPSEGTELKPNASAEASSPPPKGESVDDWLAQLRAHPPEPELTSRENEPRAEGKIEKSTAPAQENPPLVREETHVEEETVASTDSTAVEEGIPSWIQSLQPPSFLESEPADQVTQNSTTDFNADAQEIERLWSAIPAESQTPQGSAEPESPRAEISDTSNALPDWLAGVGGEITAEETDALKSATSESFEPLQQLPPELRSPSEKIAPLSDLPSGQGKPGEIKPTSESETALPSWLRDVSAKAEGVDSVLEPAEEADWVSQVGTPLEEEPPLTDLGKLGVADWLVETSISKDLFSDETAQPTVVEPGQVPDWVQALRPAEAAPIIAPLPQEAPPTTGFLAGLRGVLPLAPIVALPKVETLKPSAETLSGGATVFASILSTPAQLVEGIHADEAAKHVLPFTARLAIYFFVLVVILIPLLLPSSSAADVADIIGVGVARSTSSEFFDATHAVKSGSTVVMAFDYDAGQAGELDPAARAVMSDMLKRNIRVIVFSTTRTGAALAQSIFEQLARGNAGYVYGTNFVNLGFLPGEGTGLRNVAQNGFPTFASDFKNTSLANLPALAQVRGWQDVALTVEIAGNGDPTLKNWIEQFVQPLYGTRSDPRVAIVSAQAEPQALVYRDAKQLSGVLPGLVGGAEYEFLLNQPGRATAEVDAQSFAHLALVLLILVGNMTYWVGRARR